MAGNTTYKNSWLADSCDRVGLILPKGEKERLKAHAQKRGESLNGFIKRAIAETVERDNATNE